jgi:uncharacterized membrane protein YraQ (UPF0718 family)
MARKDTILDTIIEILVGSWTIFRESSIYFLLGLFMTGVIRVFLKPESVKRYLHGKDTRSVLLASLIGVPIPL